MVPLGTPREVSAVILSLVLSFVFQFSFANSTLTQTNEYFREQYQTTRDNLTLEDKVPLLVLIWGELYLFKNAKALKESEKNYLERQLTNTPLFDFYKTLSHIPLVLFLVKNSVSEKVKFTKKLKQLEVDLSRIHSEAVIADPFAKDLEIDTKRLERSSQILKEALSQLKKNNYDKDYFKSSLKLLRPHIYHASLAQIHQLNKTMSEWRKKHSELDFANARLLLFGKQAPRAGSLLIQYFTHFFRDKTKRYTYFHAGGKKGPVRVNSSSHVIYAEYFGYSPSETFMQTGLQLYGTHLLDAQIGQAFFGNPHRMFSDLLTEAAKKIIKNGHWTQL